MEEDISLLIREILINRLASLKKQVEAVDSLKNNCSSLKVCYFVRIHFAVYSVKETLEEAISCAEKQYQERYHSANGIYSGRYKVAVLILNPEQAMALIDSGDAEPFARIMQEEDIFTNVQKVLGLTKEKFLSVGCSAYIFIPKEIWRNYSTLSVDK
ncbi:MAG: hypothetical protein WA091_03405 [Minisyncoccales bacterium]